MIREQPLDLPNGAGALLTMPDPGRAASDIAVVLLNAGALNRSGPFRLHVVLARRLAALGFSCLRFDQPGVGDAIASASKPLHELVAENLQALQAASGCKRFVIGGLCSAADLAWRLALADPRVVGLLLLDPVARREARGFRLGQLKMVLGRGPAGWLELLRRRLERKHGAAVRPDDDELRDWPKPGEEAAQLAALVGRGVEIFALYTGGAANYMTHPRQFAEGFGAAASDPRVTFAHWSHADHLFYCPPDRERLIETVADWLRTRFGTGT